MLIDRLRDAYREVTGRMVPAEPVATVPIHQSAANASNFVKTDMQARRQRRQRRMERVGRHNISGWTVRTW